MAAAAGVISNWLTIYLLIPISEPDFEWFPVSEQIESSNSEDDSASEADAESHDEIQTGGLNDADAAAAHQLQRTRPTLICQFLIRFMVLKVHGLLLIFLSINL